MKNRRLLIRLARVVVPCWLFTEIQNAVNDAPPEDVSMKSATDVESDAATNAADESRQKKLHKKRTHAQSDDTATETEPENADENEEDGPPTAKKTADVNLNDVLRFKDEESERDDLLRKADLPPSDGMISSENDNENLDDL